MKRISTSAMKLTRIVGAFVITLVCVSLAQAQPDRTFVSTHGVDNTDCGALDQPCRTFNVAQLKTNAGGEVIALDSGIYDQFKINIWKSMTLAAAPGAHVELAPIVSDGIVISSSDTTTDPGTVVLRNLYIRGQAITSSDPAYTGIFVRTIGNLHIENCVVSGFGYGIQFNSGVDVQVSIQDTTVRDNTVDGISVTPFAGVTKVSIDHCRLQNNGRDTVYAAGLGLTSRAKVTVRDSVASGNTGVGFAASGGDLNLEHCEASNNRFGVEASTQGGTTNGGTVTVSNSIITNNIEFGFQQKNTGVFRSLGNNIVRSNGTNTSGTINVISGT